MNEQAKERPRAEALGFPVPLLGMRPMRLSVVMDDGVCLALDKPSGVLVFPDPWYGRTPVLVEAIRHQARAGKPELVRAGVGVDGLWAVHDLDPEAAGPVLFCRDRDLGERLRNDVGSNLFQFEFEFLTRANEEADALLCELPIARHASESRMLVTHKSGKLAQTEFCRQQRLGKYELWTARIALPRRHQVLIHAHESGLPVVGDRLYSRVRAPLLSQLKRDYRSKRNEDEVPLFAGPAYRLARVVLPDGRVVEAPAAKPWQGLIKRLERYAKG